MVSKDIFQRQLLRKGRWWCSRNRNNAVVMRLLLGLSKRIKLTQLFAIKSICKFSARLSIKIEELLHKNSGQAKRLISGSYLFNEFTSAVTFKEVSRAQVFDSCS